MYLARSRIQSGLTISTVFHLSNSEVRGNSRGIFIADSILFSKEQRNAVTLSNIGITVMVCTVDWASAQFGIWNVIKYYGIPWLEVTHWCSSFLISVCYLLIDSIQLLWSPISIILHPTFLITEARRGISNVEQLRL